MAQSCSKLVRKSKPRPPRCGQKAHEIYSLSLSGGSVSFSSRCRRGVSRIGHGACDDGGWAVYAADRLTEGKVMTLQNVTDAKYGTRDVETVMASRLA